MWKDYFVYTSYKQLSSSDGTAIVSNTIKMLEDFELCYISHSKTDNGSNNILIELENYSSGKNYVSQKFILLPCLSGNSLYNKTGYFMNAFMPYKLPISLFLKKGTQLTVEASDTSSATNYLRMAFHGNHFIKGDKPYDKINNNIKIYGFVDGYITLASNEGANVSVVINEDRDFLLSNLTCHATGTFSIDISNNDGKKFSNNPIHSDNLFGSGAYPNILSGIKYLKAGSELSCSIQNTSGASNTINIALIGNNVDDGR